MLQDAKGRTPLELIVAFRQDTSPCGAISRIHRMLLGRAVVEKVLRRFMNGDLLSLDSLCIPLRVPRSRHCLGKGKRPTEGEGTCPWRCYCGVTRPATSWAQALLSFDSLCLLLLGRPSNEHGARRARGGPRGGEEGGIL